MSDIFFKTDYKTESEANAEAYDRIADRYALGLANGSPIHAVALPALAELAGDCSGRRICDLACGTGVAARLIANRGGQVTGTDISEAMLDIARREEAENPLGIRYVHEDAQTLEGIPSESFQGLVCSLALMDIPDLPACLRAVYRVLQPGGWFVFAITHPCYQLPGARWTGKAGGTVKREVRGYFKEGYWRSSDPNGVRGQVGAYHRTLTTYLNALCEAGFRLEQVREPLPRDPVGQRVPGFSEAPVVFAARFVREPGRSDGPRKHTGEASEQDAAASEVARSLCP